MYQNEIDNWSVDKNLCVFALYSSFDKVEEVKTDQAEDEGEEQIDESEIGTP